MGATNDPGSQPDACGAADGTSTKLAGGTNESSLGVGAVEGCMLGDAMFEPGAIVICSDGCNDCTCGGNGQWTSTQHACEPAYVEPCSESVQSSSVIAVHPLYHDGDKLAVAVQYRGGCLEHTWKLCVSDALQEADPPRMRLWLLDTTAERDSCYALPTRELVFDLTPIRDRRSAAHPGDENTVVLELDQENITYRF